MIFSQPYSVIAHLCVISNLYPFTVNHQINQIVRLQTRAGVLYRSPGLIFRFLIWYRLVCTRSFRSSGQGLVSTRMGDAGEHQDPVWRELGVRWWLKGPSEQIWASVSVSRPQREHLQLTLSVWSRLRCVSYGKGYTNKIPFTYITLKMWIRDTFSSWDWPRNGSVERPE